MANDKYFSNSSADDYEELWRLNMALEKRIHDLERLFRNQDVPRPLPRIDPETYASPYEGQRAIDVTDEQHTWYSDGEWRKAAAGGFAIYEIKVFEDNEVVVTGDKAFEWEIPEDLDQATLMKVEAFVTTVGSSQTQIQVANGASDMLSTKISIDSGELNSKDAAVQPVVDTNNATVAWGNHLRVDVDAAGSGAMGLGLIAFFLPDPIGTVAVEGAKGDPGGVTAWTGPWDSGTTYTTGEAASNNGSTYVAIQGSTNVEPGVDTGWEDYWMLLVEGNRRSSIELVINGNGFIVDVGIKGYIEIPFNCTIKEVTMLSDQVGSAVVDIWKNTYANHPPLDGNSITGSNPPTITNDFKSTDSVLSGWTTTIAEGDILAFNVDSCSNIQRITVSVKVDR